MEAMEAQYIVDEENYERLLDAAEELADITALNEYKALMDGGESELVPWEEARDKTGSEYGSSSSGETPDNS